MPWYNPPFECGQDEHIASLLMNRIWQTCSCCSVTQSCLTLCNSVLHYLPELAQTRVHLVSDTIQPSHPVTLFSSCFQSLSASGSFPVSQLFASGGQSIGASASVLPLNIQDWFPLGLTCLISLQSKGLSRVFSSTTVKKHQFFSTQPALRSNCHMHTWLLGKP